MDIIYNTGGSFKKKSICSHYTRNIGSMYTRDWWTYCTLFCSLVKSIIPYHHRVPWVLNVVHKNNCFLKTSWSSAFGLQGTVKRHKPRASLQNKIQKHPNEVRNIQSHSYTGMLLHCVRLWHKYIGSLYLVTHVSNIWPAVQDWSATEASSAQWMVFWVCMRRHRFRLFIAFCKSVNIQS